MQVHQGTILLFGLNLLDALLTLLWVRNGVAPEGNHLMDRLLNIGDGAFIGAKIAIGLTTCTILLLWSDYKVARYGLNFALTVYGGVMVIHLLTGLHAVGVI